MRSPSRRLAGVVLFALWVVACRGEPTGPRLPAPSDVQPAYEVTGGGGGSEGSVPLLVPPTNSGAGYGAVPAAPVVGYAAGDFVRLQIDGVITTEVNPTCTEQGYPVWWGGGAWGPWGSPTGEFVVQAYYEPGRPMAIDPSGQGTTRKVAFGWFDRPGTALVGRSGGGGSCGGAPGLFITGSQTVQYEAYPVAEVTASPSFLVRGDTAVLSAASHWEIGGPAWVLQSNDTTDVALGPRWGQEICRGALSCAHAPARSGRVYLTGTILGLSVHAVGPILWVRDSVPDFCASGAPAGVDGPQGVAGPACPPDEPPPEEGEDSLVVSLTLSGDSVGPVLHGTFNAVTQYWEDLDAAPRMDTIRVTVSARFEPSGRPVSGASVQLRVEAVDGSGGHRGPSDPDKAHPSRPPGRWFAMVDVPLLFNSEPFDERKTLSLVTSADGTAGAYYRTSGLGGLDGLWAVVTAEGRSVEAAATILVKQGGLVAVARTGNAYAFEPEAVNSHGGNENHLASGVITLLDGILTEYRRCHQADPPQCPMSGASFTVTGASLVNGGLFDIDLNWRTPRHQYHRVGRDVDIDNADVERAGAEELRDICKRDEYRYEGVTTHCRLEATAGHFHVYFGSTHYHRRIAGSQP